MHEIMISEDDSHLCYEFKDFFIIAPSIVFQAAVDYSKTLINEVGQKVSSNFIYASNTNTQWLTKEEILKELESLKIS